MLKGRHARRIGGWTRRILNGAAFCLAFLVFALAIVSL